MGNPKQAGFVRLSDEPRDSYSDVVPLLSTPRRQSPTRQPTAQQSPAQQSPTRQPHLSNIGPVAAPRDRQFPTSFNGYYQKKITTTFQLGEHANQPLFAVKTHTGWSGAPGVVLHDGPSDKDPPLAAAGNETGLETERHKDTLVILPPSPGSGNDISHEFLRHDPSYTTESYRFTIEVGLGGDKGVYPETFEWRLSRGEEVKELNKHNKQIYGWELIRLNSDVDVRANEPRDGPPVTTDGKEIVAVWARYAGWSLTKAFRFQFMGSGASGEMGQRWAIMAVITALRIWCLEGMGQTDEGLAASSI